MSAIPTCVGAGGHHGWAPRVLATRAPFLGQVSSDGGVSYGKSGRRSVDFWRRQHRTPPHAARPEGSRSLRESAGCRVEIEGGGLGFGV